MNRRLWAIAAWFIVLGLLAASLQPGSATVKDQSRIGEEASEAEPEEPPAPEVQPDETVPPDTPALEDMPPVEPIELTLEAAKMALDAFADIRDKYNDLAIDQFESLEEFVEKAEAGKRLEADIKAHGFQDVTEWNRTITTVGLAYTAVADEQEAIIRQEIEATRADATLDEQTRTRIIANLSSMLPSENNKKVLRELLEDPIYREKLKLLEEVE